MGETKISTFMISYVVALNVKSSVYINCRHVAGVCCDVSMQYLG
jgi:hypothetical protein